MNAPVRLIDQVVGATVGLHATVPESHPSVAILGTERNGSGVVIDPSGLILTAHYIALGAATAHATLVSGDVFPTTVVAQDFATGLAVLHAESAGKLPAAAVRSSAGATVGQEVFIVASVGAEKRRGNSGCITSLASFDAYWEYRLDRAICTTAVNPGLGGAPLFDMLGAVIGIVLLDLAEIGRFTLAVPAENYLDHRDELLRFGRRARRQPRAWVGFTCYNVRDHIVIAGVLPGAPGESAGLRPGDVVLAVGGRRVATRNELYEQLWAHRAGERVTFEVFRGDSVKTIAVASADAEEFFG